jgi:MoaA/NifB/PqqE/SkfB family radical SAM enzyme
MLENRFAPKDRVIRELPILVLMPFEGCNCRCVMCDYWRTGASAARLSRDDIEGMIESMQRLQVQWVVLSGGEALLHPELWSICDRLTSLQVRMSLLTNGLLLARHAREAVRFCDEIIVSLDGSRDVHDRIRGVAGAFDRLAEGVQAVKKIRPSLSVTARCVVQKANHADLHGIIEAAHDLGLDRLSFLAVDVSSTAFRRPAGDSTEPVATAALDSAQVAELSRFLDEVVTTHAADFSTGFIAESPKKLRRLPRYFAAVQGEKAFPSFPCNAPWVSAVVEADGAVRPCFFHEPCGNIRDEPLDRILNAPGARTFRKHLDVRKNAVCRSCVCPLYLDRRTPR